MSRKKICLLFVVIFTFVIAGCSDNNNNQEQYNPSQPMYDYIIKVRTTQFDLIEDVKFMSGDTEISATFENGVYSLQYSGDFSGVTPVKDGLRFGEYYEYDASNNGEVIKKYFVATETGSNVNFSKPFGFHGKICDAETGEIGIPNAQIKIGDNVVFVTDETGNFDISYLYEETWFIFTCDGYRFNPAFICITEETEGLHIRGTVD